MRWGYFMRADNYFFRWQAWLAAVALPVLTTTSACAGGIVQPGGPGFGPLALTMSLVPATGSSNQFGVATELNTLVPGRASERAGGSVGWAGDFPLDLYLGGFTDDGLPNVLGIKIRGAEAGIAQSPISLPYGNLPVNVRFDTNTINSVLEQTSHSLVVAEPGTLPGEYHFAANQFQLMQQSGVAGVMVEGRPSKMQELATLPTTMGAIHSMSSLMIERMHGYGIPTYMATFQMPLGGQIVQYAGTGLPVEWRYTSGNLVATAMFTAIPEPSSITLLALLAAAAGVWLRRAG